MSQTYRFWTHSTHVRTDKNEAIVVKEKVATQNDDGTVTFSNNLNTIVNPKRKYYIHQTRYRNYEYKIEYVPLNQCDEFICYNKDIERDIRKRLDLYETGKFGSLRELCNSPYLYGADVNIEVLIKIGYMKKVKEVPILPKYTFGALDLEVSVLGDEQINLASYCFDGIIDVWILDSFLYKITDEKDKQGNPKRVKATLDDVIGVANDEIGDYLERFKLSVRYHLVQNEMELITKLINRIHETKADFCGVWNMPYDIPKLIERIEKNKGDKHQIFCHPDVPYEYRKIKYKPDTSHVDHFTDSWDWFNCPGHTQFIDSMRLYSRLRKVKGREPSYTLNAISVKEIKHGKLDLGGTHYYNQLYNFLHYIAYNIVDSANVWLMEQQNGDVSSMCMLVGNSLLKDFSKQTVMLKNDFYEYCLNRGMIAGTVGEHMGTPFDDLLGKAGGTVLAPYLAKDMGLQCIEERPNLHTLINIFIKDIDAASMYPYTMTGFNISKETTKATMVKLHGLKTEDIEELFTAMIAPNENALLIGKKFFGLPSANELIKGFHNDVYIENSN